MVKLLNVVNVYLTLSINEKKKNEIKIGMCDFVDCTDAK